MTHICVGNLAIIGSDNGLSPGRRHYLNQCWNIVNWTFRNKLQWNFNRNLNIFIQENALDNVVCEMAFILSRPQCVKYLHSQIGTRRNSCVLNGCLTKMSRLASLSVISQWPHSASSTAPPTIVPLRTLQVRRSGPRLNIKTVLSTYGDFHVNDKTAVRTSYL